jgi:hypothetical protein
LKMSTAAAAQGTAAAQVAAAAVPVAAPAAAPAAAAAQGTAAAQVAAAAVAMPVPVATPAAAPAGAAVVPEPSDAPGISHEQLRVWREKFEAKVVTLADDARSLMSEDKADLIVDLLRNWDSLTPAQRKAKTPNYIYFKNRYMLSGESDLIKTDGRFAAGIQGLS